VTKKVAGFSKRSDCIKTFWNWYMENCKGLNFSEINTGKWKSLMPVEVRVLIENEETKKKIKRKCQNFAQAKASKITLAND
jgi:hypothetical protein